MTTSLTSNVVQLNGRNLQFIINTGIVDKVAKRVETSINASASGGGARHYGNVVVSNPTTLNVQSSNTTVTELWMRDGDRELDHTLRMDLSVREEQKISIISLALENARFSHYVGIVNHNTGTWQALNTPEYLIQSTVMSKMSTGFYFVMVLFAFFLWPMFATVVATIIGLGGIIYLSIYRSNKMSALQKELGGHVAEIKKGLQVN